MPYHGSTGASPPGIGPPPITRLGSTAATITVSPGFSLITAILSLLQGLRSQHFHIPDNHTPMITAMRRRKINSIQCPLFTQSSLDSALPAPLSTAASASHILSKVL